MATYTLDTLPDLRGRFKLIALDLDGTLLTGQKTISERNKAVLNKARAQGMAVVITSGRPPKSCYKYMADLGPVDKNSYAVIFNGSALVSLYDYEQCRDDVNFPTIWHVSTPGSEVAEIARLGHQYGCYPHGYGVQQGLCIEGHNPGALREINHNDLPYEVIDFEKLTDEVDFYKLLCSAPAKTIDNFRPHIPAWILDKYAIMRSDADFLEFIPQKQTKGTALAQLCRILNIDLSEIIACGDAENDEEMIKMAGLGVAMANSMPHVIEVADVVTSSNEDDGVAEVIEKVLL